MDIVIKKYQGVIHPISVRGYSQLLRVLTSLESIHRLSRLCGFSGNTVGFYKYNPGCVTKA